MPSYQNPTQEKGYSNQLEAHGMAFRLMPISQNPNNLLRA